MTTTMQTGTAIADDLLQRIGETVGDKAHVSAVFGEPIKAEGITLIPVGKAQFAFGGGGGAGERSQEYCRERKASAHTFSGRSSRRGAGFLPIPAD